MENLDYYIVKNYYKYKAKDYFFAIFMVLFFLACITITIGIAVTKREKIVDKDYKGKYIKVMRYQIFNTDSTTHLYNKPRTVTAKVINVTRRHVYLVYNEEEFILRHHNPKQYIIGERIKAIEYFYPNHYLVPI